MDNKARGARWHLVQHPTILIHVSADNTDKQNGYYSETQTAISLGQRYHTNDSRCRSRIYISLKI